MQTIHRDAQIYVALTLAVAAAIASAPVPYSRDWPAGPAFTAGTSFEIAALSGAPGDPPAERDAGLRPLD